MFRVTRSTCIYSARLLVLAVALQMLTGCAAVVTSVALIPVQMAAQVIMQSAQNSIDMASAGIHDAIDAAE
ncbi:MAG: hypothetical protein ACYC26_02635 [Phycisphaerales bacterium]